ncbi:MAG: cupin domain-containing protein [Coraliomargarita sp.]
MKTRVLHPDESKTFETVERCSILEYSNDSDDPELSVARARVAPGVTTAWHHLIGVSERYFILEGEGCVEIGDAPPETVTPGAVVRIPPGVRQRIKNAGTSDLVFLALCTPRFTPDCYVDWEH